MVANEFDSLQNARGVRRDHMSMSRLLERGWTKAMVESLLGDPDKTARNPVYLSASPMKLYSTDRVVAVEKTQQFEKRQIEARKRQSTMRQVSKRKRAEALRWAESVEIAVPNVPLEEALRRGFEHWRLHQIDIALARGHEFPPNTPDGIDAATRRRWAANWLRHCCTNYDDLLIESFGKVAKDAVYLVIKNRVNAAIDLVLGGPSDTINCLAGRPIHNSNQMSLPF